MGNLVKFCLYLLILSQLAYSVKLFLSPVYFLITLILSVLVILATFVLIRQSVISKKFLYEVIIGLILIFYMSLVTFTKSKDFSSYVNFILGIGSYLMIRFFQGSFDKMFWVRLILFSVTSGLFILGADSTWRVLNPSTPDPNHPTHKSPSDSFYYYKFGSLMFGDSNTTALASLTLLFSLLAVFDSAQIRKHIRLVFFHLLIILSTFSRAAYFGTLIGLINTQNLLVRFFLYALAFFSIPFLLSFFLNDLSFLSKIIILNLIANYFQNTSFVNQLWGIGLDNSITYFEIYTHILPLTLYIETGFVGLFLFILFLLINLINTRLKSLIIWIPLLVTGLSYFIYIGTPFIFIPIALCSNVFMLKEK